jgi:hypothetical protein
VKSLARLLFPASLDRVEYTARLFVCIFAVVLLYYFRGLEDIAANVWALIIWNYIAFFVILPRARECGMSFMWALFALVPIIFPFLSVALIFRPREYDWRTGQ